MIRAFALRCPWPSICKQGEKDLGTAFPDLLFAGPQRATVYDIILVALAGELMGAWGQACFDVEREAPF